MNLHLLEAIRMDQARLGSLLNDPNRMDTAPVPATIADVPAYSGLPSRYRVVERMAYPHLGRTLMVGLED